MHPDLMTSDSYLQSILLREAVDTGPYSPVRGVVAIVQPHIAAWAGQYLVGLSPSGSFAKGTANKSGTDIDLFISLSSATPDTLKQVYESLFRKMTEVGGAPKRQNVSISVKVNGYSVDLVPAKQQDVWSQDHSLYRRRADTWTKTNIATHIKHVVTGGRRSETRIVKLWRNQKGLDFPSFYLELSVIAALSGYSGSLSDNVWKVFHYLRDTFPKARIVDPANTNNVISQDLADAERTKIKSAADLVLNATNWEQIVR
jgi:hypothetical protein